MTLKLIFTAFLLDAQHQRDTMENKPASLLVVPLGKALNGIPPSWCGRQMAGNSLASSYSGKNFFKVLNGQSEKRSQDFAMGRG